MMKHPVPFFSMFFARSVADCTDATAAVVNRLDTTRQTRLERTVSGTASLSVVVVVVFRISVEVERLLLPFTRSLTRSNDDDICSSSSSSNSMPHHCSAASVSPSLPSFRADQPATHERTDRRMLSLVIHLFDGKWQQRSLLPYVRARMDGWMKNKKNTF